MQLFNNSTGVVMAEKTASSYDYLFLDINNHSLVSVTWTGDYICRFPSDMITSTSSRPPFAVTILGKSVQVQLNVELERAVLYQARKCFSKLCVVCFMRGRDSETLAAYQIMIRLA